MNFKQLPLLILIILTNFLLLYSQTFYDDSLAVRKILDTNNLPTISVDWLITKSNNRITGLRLVGTPDKYITIIPDAIGQLTALTYLLVRGSESLIISKEIGRLLSLDTCILKNMGYLKIPNEIGQCKNLRYLDLGNRNHLVFEPLPEGFWELTSLRYLNLSSWKGLSIPPTIGKLKDLEILDLSSMQMHSLPKEIGSLSKLQKLNLYWNNNLQVIPEELYSLHSLRYLNISCCRLDSLSAHIANLMQLDTLILMSDYLTNLPATIVNLQHLTHLDLSNNSIHPKNLTEQLKKWVDTFDPDWLQNQQLPLFSITNYSTDSGLPFNTIQTIAFDSTGNWWIGSVSQGVGVYDGSTWRVINKTAGLISDSIHALLVDKNNVVWIGTSCGVSAYNSKTKCIRNYTTRTGLAGNNISSISVDKKGSIWFGCYGKNAGVSKLSKNRFTTFRTVNGLASNYVHCISFDADNNPWVGTQKGLSVLQGTKWKRYTTINDQNIDDVFAITFDSTQIAWVGLSSLGSGAIYTFDQQQWVRKIDAWQCPLTLSIDTYNRVWAGSNSIGLYMYDGIKTKVFTLYDGIISNMITNVVTDKTKSNIWITTISGISQLQLFEPITYQPVSYQPMPPATIQNSHDVSLFIHRKTINLYLSQSQKIHASLYDLKGRFVRDIFFGFKEKGSHQLLIQNVPLPHGFYVVSLKTETTENLNKKIYLP